jgi:hypothetical protein
MSDNRGWRNHTIDALIDLSMSDLSQVIPPSCLLDGFSDSIWSSEAYATTSVNTSKTSSTFSSTIKSQLQEPLRDAAKSWEATLLLGFELGPKEGEQPRPNLALSRSDQDLTTP